MQKNCRSILQYSKRFRLFSVLNKLDPDAGEPKIYGSNWIQIQIDNTGEQ